MRSIGALVGFAALVAAAPAAYAGADGIAEAGLGVALPVADGGYRSDFATSPTLWLAGVYLPRYSSRALGVELGFEYTPYADDFRIQNGASTDFSRFRIQLGARYFRPLAPKLVGFARAVGGIEIFAWTQDGSLGTVHYNDSDEHIGVALELGSGVVYQIGSVALGAQLALPVGVHREVKHDGTLEINQTSFDLELRLTIGTQY